MAGIGDSWGTREELLHPRDKHGRFRSKWKMAEGVVNKILAALAAFNPRTFQSDGQASQYLHNKAKPGRFGGGQGYARLSADYHATQDALRAGTMDTSTKKFVDMMDASSTTTTDDIIVHRRVGPEAFGLTPETMALDEGGIEDFTGKLVADRGYGSSNIGTPMGTGPIQMTIAVPKGSKVIIPARSQNDRQVYLDRDQEVRVTKVDPDGRGGFYVLAVATPRTPGETPEPVGGPGAPSDVAPREGEVLRGQELQAKSQKIVPDEPLPQQAPQPGDGGPSPQGPVDTGPGGPPPRNEPVVSEAIGTGGSPQVTTPPAGAPEVPGGTPEAPVREADFKEAAKGVPVPSAGKRRMQWNNAYLGIRSGKRDPDDILRELDKDIEVNKGSLADRKRRGDESDPQLADDITAQEKLAELIRSHYDMPTEQQKDESDEKFRQDLADEIAAEFEGEEVTPEPTPVKKATKKAAPAKAAPTKKAAPAKKATPAARGMTLVEAKRRTAMDALEENKITDPSIDATYKRIAKGLDDGTMTVPQARKQSLDTAKFFHAEATRALDNGRATPEERRRIHEKVTAQATKYEQLADALQVSQGDLKTRKYRNTPVAKKAVPEAPPVKKAPAPKKSVEGAAPGTAAGKITSARVTPGTVLLVHKDSAGAWAPTTRKTGATKLTVTGNDAIAGGTNSLGYPSRRTRRRITGTGPDGEKIQLDVTPSQTFIVDTKGDIKSPASGIEDKSTRDFAERVLAGKEILRINAGQSADPDSKTNPPELADTPAKKARVLRHRAETMRRMSDARFKGTPNKQTEAARNEAFKNADLLDGLADEVHKPAAKKAPPSPDAELADIRDKLSDPNLTRQERLDIESRLGRINKTQSRSKRPVTDDEILGMTKPELIAEARRRGVDIQPSWTKDKIKQTMQKSADIEREEGSPNEREVDRAKRTAEGLEVTVPELKRIAAEEGVTDYKNLRKADLQAKIRAHREEVANRTPEDQAIIDSLGDGPTPAPGRPEDEQSIIRALRRVEAAQGKKAGDWVGIADLRDAMEADGISRADQDTALRKMARGDHPGVRSQEIRLIPVANRKALTDRDRAAALRTGEDQIDAIKINPSYDNPTPAPVPATPTSIMERISSFDNPPTREEAHELLKPLMKRDLVAMANDLSVPGAQGKTKERLRDEIVQATAGGRRDSIATRGFRGVRPDSPDIPDTPTREIEVDNRVRAAYVTALAAKGGPGQTDNRWVMISDLRPELGDLSREEVDAALIRMGRGDYDGPGKPYVIPESNQKALTPADRAGAVRFGGQNKHVIRFDDPSPRPLPGAGTPQAPVVANPVAQKAIQAPDRQSDFDQAWGAGKFDAPGSAGRSLDEIRGDVSAGRITPDEGIRRLESEIDLNTSEIADIDRTLRGDMGHGVREQLQGQRRELVTATDAQARASTFMRSHFKKEPLATPDEVAIELDDDARKALDEATPEGIRRAAKAQGITVKGETKEEILKDLVRQMAGKELERRAAPKKVAPAPKAPDKPKPNLEESPYQRIDTQALAEGLDLRTEWDRKMLARVQEQLDGTDTSLGKNPTPAQIGRNLESWANGAGGPGYRSATMQVTPNDKRGPEWHAEHDALGAQHKEWLKLADRLKNTRRRRKEDRAPDVTPKVTRDEKKEIASVAEVTGIPAEQLEAKALAKKKAEAPPKQSAVQVADTLKTVGSREEAEKILRGRTKAELQEIIKAAGVTSPGSRGSNDKPGLIRSIIQSQVGARLEGEALRGLGRSNNRITRLDLEEMPIPDLKAIEDDLGIERTSLNRGDRIQAILDKQAEAPTPAPAPAPEPAAPATPKAKPSGAPVRRSHDVPRDNRGLTQVRERPGNDEDVYIPNGGRDQGAMHFDSEMGQLWTDLYMDDREPNSFVNEIARMGDRMGYTRGDADLEGDVIPLLERLKGQAVDSGAAARIQRTIDAISAPPVQVPDLPEGTPAPIRAALEKLSKIPTARKTGRVGMNYLDESILDKKVRLLREFVQGGVRGRDFEREFENRDLHESSDGAFRMWSLLEKLFTPTIVTGYTDKGEPIEKPNPDYPAVRDWLRATQSQTRR